MKLLGFDPVPGTKAAPAPAPAPVDRLFAGKDARGREVGHELADRKGAPEKEGVGQAKRFGRGPRTSPSRVDIRALRLGLEFDEA